MDRRILQICYAKTKEDVFRIEPHFKLPTSVKIPYQRINVAPSKVNHVLLVMVCIPSPFTFESTNVVPWKYVVTIIVNRKEESAEYIPK